MNVLSLNNNAVAKFSGDEFIIYCSEFREFEEIDNLLTYINKTLKEILILENKKVYITTSIGISIYPTDAKEIEKLIVNADSAMYRVKEKGKNGHLYFNDEMVKLLQERANIESAIRDSVDKNLFKMVYQPQVSLYTGKITGLEALIRMKNYRYTPDVFIPIAEETGSIIPIGRWVIKTVIEQISEWLKEGVEVKPIAINFSPKQLMDKSLHQYLNNILDQYDIPAKYVEIEITENILIDNIEETLCFLNKIKNLGIKMALDDFGAGFSSIKYLSTLPIDKVKLDKSMINKFTSEDKDEVIRSIVQLSHCFELSFLAEGVEDEFTMLKLKACGCDTIQGYYFSKPLEVEEIKNIMNVTFDI